jgi:RimJ/RimL family protein N-acetyltransferase
MSESITTDRLTLRPARAGDGKAITAYVNDPRIYEKVARIAPGQTLQVTQAWLQAVERDRARGLHHLFAIDIGGAFVGLVGAHTSHVGEPFEIGYWLAPEAWSRGIATEAAGALIAWLEKIGQGGCYTSGYFADNPASGRVLEKTGFRETHRAPVFCLGRGCEIDHVFMVRTKETG